MAPTASDQAPFAIYIHWPFCAAKCPYCDFNSHVRHGGVDQKEFVRAYERELAHFATLTGPKTVNSIFFGGGTPSLMEAETVERILGAISKHWSLADDVEISLEANPTSVEATRFAAYANAGVNRVSLGVQSLDDAQLKFLGRLHTADEARSAIELARKYFKRMSFDLIYARPGQNEEAWRKELDEAVSLAADHLSLYQLTIEMGTPFFALREKGALKVPDGERAAELYEVTQQVMQSHNMPAYEISNHAQPGAECQHNLIYWRYQDYLGIGPGAHGRLTHEDRKIATAMIRNPEDWFAKTMDAGHGMEVNDRLNSEEMADEFLVMGLRLSEGISPQTYEQLSGAPFNPSRQAFLLEQGFIEIMQNGNLRATPSGFLVLDAVVADLAA